MKGGVREARSVLIWKVLATVYEKALRAGAHWKRYVSAKTILLVKMKKQDSFYVKILIVLELCGFSVRSPSSAVCGEALTACKSARTSHGGVKVLPPVSEKSRRSCSSIDFYTCCSDWVGVISTLFGLWISDSTGGGEALQKLGARSLSES